MAQSPRSPDTVRIGVNNDINDSGVLTGLYVNAAVLGLIVVGVCLMQRFLNAHHRLRLSKPSVVIKPPVLPEKGHKAYWYWVWVTLTTSNVDLLKSSGLDALMLVKTMAFGMQLFIPMTLLGIGMLLPIHKSGSYLAKEKTGEASELLTLTVANLDQGSDLMWVHFCLVYIYILYALLLLRYHYYNYVRMRELYIKEGEDINYWQEVHMTTEEPKAHLTRMLSTVVRRPRGESEGIPATMSPTVPPSPQVITSRSSVTRHPPLPTPQGSAPQPAAPPGGPTLQNSGDPPSPARSSSTVGSQGRVIASLDLLESHYFDEGQVQGSAALLSRADEAPPRRPMHARNQSWSHAKTAKAFPVAATPDLDTHMDVESGMGSLAPTPSGNPPVTLQPAGGSVGSTNLLLDNNGSSNSRPSFNRWWEMKVSTRTPSLRSLHPSSSTVAPPAAPNGASPVATPPTTTRASEANPRRAQCALSNIPSVRYRKTVNTSSGDGRTVSVNAQQYVILVTNVGEKPGYASPPRQMRKAKPLLPKGSLVEAVFEFVFVMLYLRQRTAVCRPGDQRGQEARVCRTPLLSCWKARKA